MTAARGPADLPGPLVLVAALAAVAAGGARAAEWAVAPRLSLSVELDDNGPLRRDAPQGVTGLTTEVEAALSVREERRGLTLTPRLTFARFDDEPDAGLDRNDWRVRLHGFSDGERDRLELSGELVRDRTRTSELADTGRIETDRRRTLLTASPRWRHAFSERWAGAVSASLAEATYADAEGTGLVDYRYHAAEIALSHRWSERTVLEAAALASRYEASDIGARSDSAGLRAGLRHSLGETLRADLSLGVRAARSRPAAGAGRVTSRGLLLGAGFEKRYERARIEGRLARSLSPSASGGLRERDRLDLAAAVGLGPRLEARAALLVSESRDVEGADDPARYQRASAGLFWRLSPFWLLSGEYRYSRLDPAGAARAADSNAVVLTLRYSGARHSWAR